jgi:hypothetical protein
MGEMHVVLFGEQLAAALFVAFAWLAICRRIRVLRGRPRVSYLIASLLVVAACGTLPDGLTPAGLAAGVIVLTILYLLYKRALRRRSFEAATIISYENRNVY